MTFRSRACSSPGRRRFCVWCSCSRSGTGRRASIPQAMYRAIVARLWAPSTINSWRRGRSLNLATSNFRRASTRISRPPHCGARSRRRCGAKASSMASSASGTARGQGSIAQATYSAMPIWPAHRPMAVSLRSRAMITQASRLLLSMPATWR